MPRPRGQATPSVCRHRRTHHAQHLYTAPGPRRYPALQRGCPNELPRATCTSNPLSSAQRELCSTLAILRWLAAPAKKKKTEVALAKFGYAACMCALRHMHCVMCVTPCAHCYAIHASFVRCQRNPEFIVQRVIQNKFPCNS